MTGGDCEIQDIQPYFGDGPDTYTQLDIEGLSSRNPKTVTSQAVETDYIAYLYIIMDNNILSWTTIQ